MDGFNLWLADMQRRFYVSFIYEDRWVYVVKGLQTTLEVTFFACLIGILLGMVVASIRFTHDTTGKLKILNWFCRVYLTVIRGTPVIVQLMIICFLILGPMGFSANLCGIIGFGINSGAYVAEIVRGGIQAVDRGQMEAGRSLGFNYLQTMMLIILPQAFKTVLPSLGNEFIVLLKETSVLGYAAGMDLTKAGDIIRGRTFDAFFPLISVALIYLAMVMFFDNLVLRLERRLKQSDH